MFQLVESSKRELRHLGSEEMFDELFEHIAEAAQNGKAAVSSGDGFGGGVGVRGLSNPKAGRGFREKRGGEQKSK
ncbi:hypothetical protein HPB50_018778 [Hyalomma asiaticum]|uniref:Uncharacterized protein n=1 Tax=Hyalomma asiaticum TaxID=266040 RepID=A0ACB7RJG0_HYAAI|nr:hypothetical protein HPB50_018778 [Hyalomma asiaticum]